MHRSAPEFSISLRASSISACVTWTSTVTLSSPCGSPRSAAASASSAALSDSPAGPSSLFATPLRAFSSIPCRAWRDGRLGRYSDSCRTASSRTAPFHSKRPQHQTRHEQSAHRVLPYRLKQREYPERRDSGCAECGEQAGERESSEDKARNQAIASLIARKSYTWRFHLASASALCSVDSCFGSCGFPS